MPTFSFDLDALFQAMPTSTSCYVNSLPTEVLAEIFESLLLLPPARPSEPPSPVLVSHICTRWRTIVLNMTTQWSYFHLTHTRHPAVLASFLTRSKHRPLRISIHLVHTTNIELAPKAVLADFRGTFQAIHAHLGRLRALHIASTNQTLHTILNVLLKNISFPALEHLSLTQSPTTGPLRHFGPMSFNPAVFHHLRLDHAMIDCTAASLSGLRSICLINTPSTLLAHIQLTHTSYPLIPAAPAMPHLTQLRLHGIHLALTSPAAVINSMTSFNPAHLRELTLAHIHIPSEAALGAVHALLAATVCAAVGLRELTLVDLDNVTFACFVSCLHGVGHIPGQGHGHGHEHRHPLRYPALKQLTLASLHPRLIDLNFMMAFPAVERVVMREIAPAHVLDFLRDGRVWPLVSKVEVWQGGRVGWVQRSRIGVEVEVNYAVKSV